MHAGHLRWLKNCEDHKMKVVTFGEIMARLAPEGFLRFRQVMPGKLNVTFAGAEANVAVSIALLGGESAFVTALPNNALADACIANLKALGVNTQHIVRTDIGRLGLYFVETGANQRPSRVIYDRAHSSVSQIKVNQYPWEIILKDKTWFHTTGITPSLSKTAADATLSAVQKARSAGLGVSCDLNFRKKLWRWDDSLKPRELAEKTMRAILPFIDVVIANEEDAADVLGIHAEDTDVHSGKLAIDKYPQVAREIASQFNNVSTVAITLRESISASHNNWGAMLYDVKSDQAFFAPVQNGQYTPYQIRNIVDRVGGGDAFGAGLIFALQTPELSAPENAVAFATAASCLAQSILGDFNYNSREEVETLMKGSASGRVVR
jgi:2-dehydro-3-deoxygluconokinase